MSGSSSPERCATTTGTITPKAAAASGTRRVYAQSPNATTGAAARARSIAEAGSTVAATSAITSASTGTRRRSLVSSNHSWPDAATRRLYWETLVSDIVPETEPSPPTTGGAGRDAATSGSPRARSPECRLTERGAPVEDPAARSPTHDEPGSPEHRRDDRRRCPESGRAVERARSSSTAPREERGSRLESHR